MKADVRFCHLGIGQEILLWGIDCSTTTEIAVSQEYITNTSFLFGQWWEATWFWFNFGGIMGYPNSFKHHELVPHYLMWRMIFAATWLKKQQPTTNCNDYVVATRNAGRHSRVSLSTRLEGFIFPGRPHPKEPRYIFGHILTQFSPWDPLWICAALMYPNTMKFLIKSLENLWKTVQNHRISSEILPSSGSPSFTASTERSRLPGPWRSPLSRLSSPRANRIRSLALCLRPKGPRDWRR